MIFLLIAVVEDGESELTTIQMLWESVFVVLLWVQRSLAVGFKFEKDLSFYEKVYLERGIKSK